MIEQSINILFSLIEYYTGICSIDLQNILTYDIKFAVSIMWIVTSVYFFLTMLLGSIKQSLRNKGKRNDLLIVQITTIGNTTVNNIVMRLRNYEIKGVIYWLVIEEWDNENKYKGFDKIIKVPTSFNTKCKYKARALEYSRKIRLEMVEKGELPSEYKVIQCDDDSIPSKELMLEAKNTPYDILMATIKPNLSRGSILARIADYERSFACSCICSLFTSIKHPIWAHGEALAFNHKVDRLVNLDMQHLMASEDMVFTHIASKYSIKMSNTTNIVSITPPLTFSDLIKQRKRWIWGDIMAIRYILPLSSKLRLIFAYGIGIICYTLAMMFIPIISFNIISLTEEQYTLTSISLLIWLLTRFIAIGKVHGLKHGIIATILTHVIITINFIANVKGLLSKPPKKFEVIQKTI